MENNKPMFSIIVPVYNAFEFLPQCIESILNQNFKNFEIIAVDDGSTDKSGELLDKYSLPDRRVKVIHKENGGVVSARKAGAENCGGEYVLSVDSDDYMAEGLLSALFEAVCENNRPDVILFDYIYFDGKSSRTVKSAYPYGLYTGEKLKNITDNIIYDKNLPSINTSKLTYALWDKAIKRELLTSAQKNVPETIVLGDDLAVMANVLTRCTSIYILDFEGYYYRKNESSLTHTFKNADIKRFEIVCDYLESILGEKYKNNINSYALFSLQYCLTLASRNFEDAETYDGFIKENLSEKMFERVKHSVISKPSVKDRIFIFIVKHKMWKLLYKIYDR